MKHFFSPKSLTMACGLIALTVIPAVIHGRLTNRWGPGVDTKAAAGRLDRCPDLVGNWKKVGEQTELSSAVVRELQLAGYVELTYMNQQTAEQVTVLLMVGSPGALSRHPPEICYDSRSNERVGKPIDVTLTTDDQTRHGFRLLRYTQPGQLGGDFSVCYGFTTDGIWSRPKYPRIEFGARPLLYKMQVLSEGIVQDEGELPEAIADFLRQFLPVLLERVIEDDPSPGG